MTTASQVAALQAVWPSLTATNTLTRLAQLNAMMVAGPLQDVAASVIETYLINHNRRTALFNFVTNTPSSPNAQALLAANYLYAILQGVDGGLFRASTEPGLLALMAGLTADARTGVTAGDITALNGVAQPQASWWSANGFAAPVGLPDLMAAGNLF